MNINFKRMTDWKRMLRAVVRFWQAYYRCVFIFFLLVALGAGTYVWYNRVYNFQWTEQEKTDYRQSTIKEINLNAEAFKKTLEEIDQRNELFNEEYTQQKDIFKSY